jgi:hypothetical protein
MAMRHIRATAATTAAFPARHFDGNMPGPNSAATAADHGPYFALHEALPGLAPREARLKATHAASSQRWGTKPNHNRCSDVTLPKGVRHGALHEPHSF